MGTSWDMWAHFLLDLQEIIKNKILINGYLLHIFLFIFFTRVYFYYHKKKEIRLLD